MVCDCPQPRALGDSSAHSVCVCVKRQNPVSWGHWGAREDGTGEDAYVGLVGVEDLLLAAEKDVAEAAGALQRVRAGGKGKGQLVV